MSLSGTVRARVLGVSPVGLPVPAPYRWTAKVASASSRVCSPDVLCGFWNCYFRGYSSLTVNASVSTPHGYIGYALAFPGERCWERRAYAKFVKQVWGCSGCSGTFTYQVPLDSNGVIIPDDYLLIWAATNRSFTQEIIALGVVNMPPSLWAYTYFGFIYAWTQPAAVPFERKVEFPQTVEEPGTLACMSETDYVGYGPLFFDVNMPTLTNVLLLDVGLESPFEQDVKLMILGPRGSYTRQYFSGTARVPKGYSDIYLAVESSLRELTLAVWPQLYFRKLNREYFAVDNTNEKVDVHELCRENGRRGYPTYIRYVKALPLPPAPSA
jgi:hypothetical protein